MFQTKFRITNLNCEACVKVSKMELGDVPGVKDVSIDLKTGIVNLEAEREIAWSEIESVLKSVEKTAEKIN